MPSVLATTSSADARLRYRVFAGLVLLLFGLLTVRLAQMQLIDSERYMSEAAGNAIETKIIRPARGYIYDRNGVLLVDNQTTLSVTVAARYFDESKLPLIAELAMMPLEDLQEKWAQIKDRSSYQTSVLLANVPFSTFARLQENAYQLKGIGFTEDQQRRYVSDVRLTHALGYVNEINENRLDQMREQGYRLGDRIGLTGIESEYESVLRGTPGRKERLVNVHGMDVESYQDGIHDVDPRSGMALTLAVDAKVQALAESLFVNKRGGAVMMDVNTGGIISLVSAPDYPLTLFQDGLTQAEVDFVYRNEEQPLFNRATMANLPPGSTWKPFMAAAALEEGMIDEDTELYCGGGYRLGRLYRCHGGAHGRISVRTAIQKSCNTFFFRLMNDTFQTPEGPKRMNLERYGYWTSRFGFGQLAPIDIPDQNPGLIPDSSYYNQRWGVGGWGPGFTVNLGIGQGNMGANPMQLARMTAAIANGGTLLTPHLVMGQMDPETGETRETMHRRPRRVPVSAEHLAIVREGMELVVSNGTARIAQIRETRDFPEILVAGKTGTSQNPRGKDHSVFIAYAPVDDPQVAVGVIVENGGYGGTIAAPIATLMIEQYLRGEITRPGLVARARSIRSSGRI
ncbi:MAG: penicillin-binding protein 2 [Rubricoccaceae bacterium]